MTSIDTRVYRDDGRRANMAGISRDRCPYITELSEPQRDQWLAGWDEGQAMQNKPSTLNTDNLPGG